MFLSLCSQGSRESLCSEMPVRNKCVNIMTGSTGFSYPCTRGQSRSVSLLFLSAAFLFEALLFTRGRLGAGAARLLCCAPLCGTSHPAAWARHLRSLLLRSGDDCGSVFPLSQSFTLMLAKGLIFTGLGKVWARLLHIDRVVRCLPVQ